ncbi:MAG: C69 family dipeptidase [Candidatus Velthaea sp.]
MVALGSVTADGATLFAKNSDREPNEAHELLRVPAARHAPGERVRCTYVELPQVEQTYEVLLCKPFWIWGAEMGANEHGVVIGNEAVFTKVPYEKAPGLIGMDFLRLALERARTARQALDVITSLLEQYGQGGNCGFRHKTFYHNSFLVADPGDAWVLETAGKHWAAEQVKDVRSISNGITIGRRWDAASADLVSFAIQNGWCKGPDDFDFARCYSDPLYTRLSRCTERRCRTTDVLGAQRGKITVETMMRALRDHGADAGANWSPARGLTTFTVCAHAAFGPVRATQTTGSLVSRLTPDVQTHFVTGTSAPCTSIFKPVWLGGELPRTGPPPAGAYDAATLFWRHEQLHRATLREYAERIVLYRGERDGLEQRFVAGARKYGDEPVAQRGAYSAQCFADAEQAEARWMERMDRRAYPGLLYGIAWRSFDRAAGIDAGRAPGRGVRLARESHDGA